MWARVLLVPAAMALMISGQAIAQTTTESTDAQTTGQAVESQAAEPAAEEQGAASQMAGSAGGFLAEQAEDQAIASEFIGMPVTTGDGEAVGKLSDVILDRDNRIVGAVLSVGGFLGIGSKPVALPWDALQIQDGESGKFAVVTMSGDELGQAPEFKTQTQLKAEAEAKAREEAAKQQTQQSPTGSGSTTQ